MPRHTFFYLERRIGVSVRAHGNAWAWDCHIDHDTPLCSSEHLAGTRLEALRTACQRARQALTQHEASQRLCA